MQSPFMTFFHKELFERGIRDHPVQLRLHGCQTPRA
jgi:hypothetical protein